ncbi:17663_t:CDS:2, partial [Cetraspora pellucida]
IDIEKLPKLAQLYISCGRAAKNALIANQREIEKEITDHLPYVTMETLRKRTQKAFVIYDIFKEI